MILCFPRAIVVPALLGSLFVCGCARSDAEVSRVGAKQGRPGKGEAIERPLPKEAADALLGTLEQRTFRWFWDKAHATTALIPDRAPTPSFSSVAAVGFGLTAYVVGAARGWVTRDAARDRVLKTLRFFAQLPQGPDATGVGGYKGFFYHFLDMDTGLRYRDVELSSVDTSLLLGGVLVCGTYFDRADPGESEIRDLAKSLYERVDWTFFLNHPPLLSMGWTPEGGFNSYDWRGYDEAMIVYVLALGSPTHPIDAAAWGAWTASYKWASFQGYDYVQFAPLFGHQYSHLWIDFRGIQDDFMRSRAIDYFENSRRATYAHRAYAIANAPGWKDYGGTVWGLSACDGPTDATLPYGGSQRRFFSYAARGASIDDTRDDGTIAPTAAASSVAFAPEIAIPAIAAMTRRYGTELYGEYGFKDAFNPSFTFSVPVQLGHVVPGQGWFDDDQLGIDQGPIVGMIENHRSELLWRLGRSTPAIRRGLERAGFTGGWLAPASNR